MSQITFRDADINDLDLLLHWDRQAHVIACDPDDDWEWDKELPRNVPWREQLVAELNGEPIGFVQIIDPYEEESHYWGEVEQHLRAIDIWIGEAENLNKGYGTQMMQLAIERCFADGAVTKILIDPLASNVKAHRFYERLGFRFVEERIFEDSHCFVYELPRDDRPS
jgi:aminoglycoside 6'-N-acetyltransferase